MGVPGRKKCTLSIIIFLLGVAAPQPSFSNRQPGTSVSPADKQVILASPVVRRIEWGPVDAVQRYAPGTDNWPVTWADDPEGLSLDGLLYGAGGDGNGAFNKTLAKHSLILSAIRGTPPELDGKDITCMERPGNPCGCHFHFRRYSGKDGIKASGLLFVDGTLYLFVRNAGADAQGRGTGLGSRLAWSTDRGRSWHWGFGWEMFGYPTFIQYGMNYGGARNGYVYVVSHDGPDAYMPADGFVLMRVPRTRIAEKSAYEFFAGTARVPAWTDDIDGRVPVFTRPGQCQRSGISYNPGLGRYFWWQGIYRAGSHADSRFKGGFGVYDAPEPWGPWTRVYETEEWDVGPGETGSFPPKWMSKDGREMYLLFSGDDHLSIRKAILVMHIGLNTKGPSKPKPGAIEVNKVGKSRPR